MRKTHYVIDTNIIIEDPKIINKLNGIIHIPITVLKELDKLKYSEYTKSYNIREFIRILDDDSVNIHYDNSIEEKYLDSDIINVYLTSDVSGKTNDEKIINFTNKLCKTYGNEYVTLITNDIIMTLIAKTQGITTNHHELLIHPPTEIYSGVSYEEEPEYPNQYQITKSGIFRKKYNNSAITRLGKDYPIWTISHRNAEQKCAIDALMDDKIKLVTLIGHAGCGKTLLSIAAALECIFKQNSQYNRLLVSRPIIPMGNDLGYLPGSIEEKLSPWMQPIFDNMDLLFKDKKDNWKGLERDGLLKLEALTYIRGRSIPNQFIIVDEAQNLTKHEIITIVSRVGEGTKIIFAGDINQIDNPKLNSKNNGLTYIIEKFKDQPIAAHVTLKRGERSELANLAAEIL